MRQRFSPSERPWIEPLLSAQDPRPVEWINTAGSSIVLLTCEHAGRAVPFSLSGLGVEPEEINRHIAYDVGAEATARKLSALLDAPLILQRFSRLVVDCNRPFEARDSIPDVSDGTLIPGNAGLTSADREARFLAIHTPFHSAVAEALDKRAADGRPTVLVSLHSFTPVMRQTLERRRCELGLLFNRDPRLARWLHTTIRRQHPEVLVEYNQPYSVADASDYTIPVHGEARGLPHVLLEVRSDKIDTEAGQERWAGILADAIDGALDQMGKEGPA